MALIFKKHRSGSTTDLVSAPEEPSSTPVETSPSVSLENPNNPIYLKKCFVCGEVSKAEQEYIRSYGGIGCSSCRAFFRRATHRSKERPMTCHNNDRCKVNVDNRQNCKKCRYTKCLKSGMSPDAVLSDEQKTVRFRKVLSKKKQQEGGGGESVPEEDASDVQSTSSSSHRQIPILVVNSFEDNAPSYFQPKIKDIIEKYISSVERVKSKEIVQVTLASKNETQKEILKKTLIDHFVELSMQFREFANLLRYERQNRITINRLFLKQVFRFLDDFNFL
jgi:hypothetical protein